MKSNYIVYTKNIHKNLQKNSNKKSNYKVITNKLSLITTSLLYLTSYYIVITLLIINQAHANQNPTVMIKQPIVQGSFIYGKTQPNTKVFFKETEIKQTDNGEFVFALPQDTDDILYLTTQQGNTKKTWSSPIQKRQWKEEVVNGLPPKKVSPSPEDLKRISHERQLLTNQRKTTTYSYFPICFKRPVSKKARISSEFGARRILNGIKTASHSGTDYALPAGTPVYAPADGIVKLTHPDMFYSGKTILIDHGYGIFSSYSHLSKISVQSGDIIKQGQKIGEIGSTGRSTGPHLHLTFMWFGTRVDPEFVLNQYQCH